MKKWGQQIGSYSLLKTEISAKEVIDLKTLSTFDQGLRNRLIRMFLEQAPSSIDKIKRSINNEDFVNLREEAHSLKGSSLALRADQMASICEALQKKGENQDLSETSSLLRLLEENYKQLQQQLTSDFSDR